MLIVLLLLDFSMVQIYVITLISQKSLQNELNDFLKAVLNNNILTLLIKVLNKIKT